jgi:hypothetical protein
MGLKPNFLRSLQKFLETDMKRKTYVFFIAIAMALSAQLYAQKASAEFISSMPPVKFETGETIKDGVRSVLYHENYLYVVNIWVGIQVVDVSDIRNPKEISKLQTDHRAHNIFIENNYGFVSDELAGVTIVDVTDPRVLKKIGKIETQENAFWVESSYPFLYVAEGQNGVQVYDISDINTPVRLGGFDTPGFAWGLAIRENLVYVADKSGGLQIIDFSDKANPRRVGQYSNAINAKTIQIEDNNLYLTNGPDGILIIDISNPAFPALVSTIKIEGFVFQMYKAGKYAYIANEANKRVEILNLTDIKKPEREASYQAQDKIYGVWKKDVYVFVAANSELLILRHNNPPILAEIADQNIAEQSLLSIQPEGYDPDGDAFYYEIDNLPEGATLDSLRGTIAWTPDYEQSGVYANIILRIIENTDSKLTDTRTFTITVANTNRPPDIPEIENITSDENQLITLEIPEGSDPDKEDAGKLVYSIDPLPEGANFDGITRTFTWKPTFEQSGIYIVDFVVTDVAGSFDRDAVTITINHVDRKPELVQIEPKINNENQLLEFIIEGHDPDKEDQNIISFRVENLPDGAVFNSGTRTFSWTPSYNQSGSYTPMIIMKAGNLSDSITVDITVNHVNRPPILSDILAQETDEQKALFFKISVSDPDVEDIGKLTVSTSSLPEGAHFSADSLLFTWTPTNDQAGVYDAIQITAADPSGLSDTKNVTITVHHVNRPPLLAEIPDKEADENVPITFTVSGSDPDEEDLGKLQYHVNNLPQGATFKNQTFTWTPSYDQSGSYQLEFNITDGILSDMKSTTITVKHINRPPILDSLENQSVDENKILTFKVSGKDPDKEDEGKIVLSSGVLPQGAVFNPADGSFQWTPTFEQSGTYTVQFILTDVQGLTDKNDIGITVNHINRTPVFDILTSQTVDENVPLTFTVPAATDPDNEDEGKLSYSAANLPEGAEFNAETQTITWTPTYEQSGSYELQISCTDGAFTVSQPLNITVNHINRSPEISAIAEQVIDENAPFALKIEFSDPDKEDQDKLIIETANLPGTATVDRQSGNFSWTPTYDDAGVYPNITISISDPAGAKAEQVFTVTVNNVNRPPEIQKAEKIISAENQAVAQTFIATDPDKEDEGKLVFSIDNLPEGASLDAQTGSFAWTPNFLQAGNYTIKVKVTDSGELSAEMEAAIEITNVNRLPVIDPVENKSLNEGQSLSFTLTAKDEDSNDQLKFSINNLPAGANLDEKSGKFDWQASFDQAGEYPLTASVSDGTAENTTTFTIQVANVNRAPEIESIGDRTVTAGETVSVRVTAKDADGDNLSFEAGNLPGSNANLNTSDGSFTWTTSDEDVGTHTITIKVGDGTESVETSFKIEVKAKPAPEPAVPDTTQN